MIPKYMTFDSSCLLLNILQPPDHLCLLQKIAACYFLLLIQSLMAQIIWSRGCPVELLLDVHQILLDVQQNSTEHPLEFCKFASNVLKLLNSSRNAIKISTGCPVEFLDIPQNLLDFQQNCSTGRPLEQNIWRNDLYFGSKHRYDNACCFFHH